MIVAILSSCSTTSSLLVVVWWSCQSTTQQACTTHEYKLYSIALHRTHSAYNDVEWDGISGAIVLAYIYSNINDTNNIIEVEPDATQMIFPNTPIHIYWSFVLFSYCILHRRTFLSTMLKWHTNCGTKNKSIRCICPHMAWPGSVKQCIASQ